MAQEESAEKKRNFPPYVHWRTFSGIIERYKNTAVPSRLDSSVMTGLSGTFQGQIKSALRFLRLTDENDNAEESLKTLVQSFKTDQWPVMFKDVILTAYAPIINGLDITSATLTQLKDKFRTVGGIEGSTVEKGVRFYLAALQEAGVPFSPHFTARRGRVAGRRSKRTVRAKAETPVENAPIEEKRNGHNQGYMPEAPPAGTIQFPIHIPGKPQAIVIVPEDITEDEWSMIDGLFRNYIKLRHRSEQQPSSS